MERLELLSPVELLEFFRAIVNPARVKIASGKIIVSDVLQEFIPVEIEFNGRQVIIEVQFNAYEKLFALTHSDLKFQFFEEAGFSLFEHLHTWLHTTYVEWVKNDTGANLTSEFLQKLEFEIQRVAAMFAPEDES